jgi:L-iditol 2-dehydrogenase
MAKVADIDRKIDINRESMEVVVEEETAGRGVDVILIASSQVTVSSLPQLLAPGGRLCLFSGLPPETAQIPLDTNLIHYGELTVTGAYGSTAAQNSAALRLITSGKVPVAPLITRRLPLGEIEEGMDYVAKRKGLKAVVTFF